MKQLETRVSEFGRSFSEDGSFEIDMVMVSIVVKWESRGHILLRVVHGFDWQQYMSN
jgi:hypothetical protein